MSNRTGTGYAPPAIHGAPEQHAAHDAVMSRVFSGPKPKPVSEGVCDGCGMYGPRHRGVCAMCEADGFPLRPVTKRRNARVDSTKLPSAPDNFPTVERERARVLAIFAEDPAGWAEVYGHPVGVLEGPVVKPPEAA